jgi:hypothetical protein
MIANHKKFTCLKKKAGYYKATQNREEGFRFGAYYMILRVMIGDGRASGQIRLCFRKQRSYCNSLRDVQKCSVIYQLCEQFDQGNQE